MKNILFVLLLVVSSEVFSAGTCTGCSIKTIGLGPHYDQFCTSGACVFIMMNGAVTDRASCGSGSGWHFTLDVATDSGKATLAALLSAYAMKEEINIKGKGTCANSTNDLFEDLLYMSL